MSSAEQQVAQLFEQLRSVKLPKTPRVEYPPLTPIEELPFPTIGVKNWKYIGGGAVPFTKTVPFPGKIRLIEIREKGYMLAAVIGFAGSLDAQNIALAIRHGLLPGFIPETVGYATPFYLYQAGLLNAGIANSPSVTRFDTTNKVFVVKWDPPFPYPFMGLAIDLEAPAPSLDTQTEAQVVAQYLAIAVY